MKKYSIMLNLSLLPSKDFLVLHALCAFFRKPYNIILCGCVYIFILLPLAKPIKVTPWSSA
jgi:hypothetical protein